MDGLLRLANAYGVLHEMDKAQEVYLRTDALLLEGDPRKAEVQAKLAQIGRE